MHRRFPGILRAALAVALGLAASGGTAQLPPPPEPPGNPVTVSKANLGKVLFWDEQLASTRSVACGSCHIPTAGGGDARAASPLAVHPGPDGLFGGADDVIGSPGVPLSHADGLYDWSAIFGLHPQVTPRRTTSMINAAYAPLLFWDGRASGQFLDPVTLQVVLPAGAALESQAVGPPVSDVEMAHVGRSWLDVVDRLAAVAPLALSPAVPDELLAWIGGRGYAALFAEAFGTPEITAPRIAMAIASHERTLVTNQTPFDEFLATGQGLTSQEVAGRTVFAGVGRCDTCHTNALLTNQAFHYTGVRPKSDDPGRMTVTGNPADEGRMRTPSLRNVALRAPYMHNGRFATLTEVVDFYARGGDFPGAQLVPLNLTPVQRANLVAFLGRPLTDPRLAAGQPPFDRPRLYTESARAPTVSDAGLAGGGALVPEIVALEPPLIGNPHFTVAVSNGLGGADALLVIDDTDPGLTPPAGGDFAVAEIVLGGAGVGAGFGSVSLAIPNDPQLDGRQWFGRWYVTDPAAVGGSAVSRLLRFSTFAGALPVTAFVDGFETGSLAAWSTTAQ